MNLMKHVRPSIVISSQNIVGYQPEQGLDARESKCLVDIHDCLIASV